MLVMLVGFLFFKQVPDFLAILGTILIITGIVVINIFSKMGVHRAVITLLILFK